MMLALAALTALSALAVAQTPPPTSGDWVIADDTSFSNTSVYVPGDVIVRTGGSLRLEDVNVLFVGRFPVTVTTEPGGTLKTQGGTFSTLSERYDLSLHGDNLLNGTRFSTPGSITLRSWSSRVTNCTVVDSEGHGLHILPSGRPDAVLEVSGNTVEGAALDGIRFDVGDPEVTGEYSVVARGNTITGSGNEGLLFNSSGTKGAVDLEGTRVDSPGGIGILLQVLTGDVAFDVDFAEVTGAGNGLHFLYLGNNPRHFVLSDLWLHDNTGTGLVFAGYGGMGYTVRVDRSNLTGNGAGGIVAQNVRSMNVSRSVLSNDDAWPEVRCLGSNVTLFRTISRRGSAEVDDGASSVTSLWTLNVTARWQSGSPVAGRRLEVTDENGSVLFQLLTDGLGRTLDRTFWDWRVTSAGLVLRQRLGFVLATSIGRQLGREFSLGGDISGNVYFVDPTPPLVISGRPAMDEVVNTSDVLVSGTVVEEDSGVHSITVRAMTLGGSVAAVWTEASLTGQAWEVLIEDLDDGVYTLVARAYDVASFPNWSFSETNLTRFTVDTTPPSMELTSPVDFVPPQGYLLQWSEEDVRVEGVARDELTDVTVLLGDREIATVDGNFSVAVATDADGELSIELRAVDGGGNERRVVLVLLVDLTPPPLFELSIEDGAVTNLAELPFRLVTEPGALVRFQGRAIGAANGTLLGNVSLEEGWNALDFVLADVVGNTASFERSVLLDTFPPEIHIHEARDGTIEAEPGPYMLNGTTEAYASVRASWLDVVLETQATPTGHFSFTIDVGDDTFVVSVRSTDGAGNHKERAVTIQGKVPIAPPPDDGPKVPLGVGVGVLATLVFVLAMSSTEVTRYLLFLMVMPLFSRLKRREILENNLRYTILGIITENPGIHYSEIMRELGLTNGVAAYHLRVLEQRDFVRAQRDGTLKRFYSTEVKPPKSLNMTPDQIRDEIIRLVKRFPGMYQREIANELGYRRDTIGYHLREMVGRNVLMSTKKGRYTKYYFRSPTD